MLHVLLTDDTGAFVDQPVIDAVPVELMETDQGPDLLSLLKLVQTYCTLAIVPMGDSPHGEDVYLLLVQPVFGQLVLLLVLGVVMGEDAFVVV